MFRLYLPIAFSLIFILWVLFRLVVKRDLKKHMNAVYVALFFGLIWAVIYVWVLKG